jgi:hypothetical protein
MIKSGDDSLVGVVLFIVIVLIVGASLANPTNSTNSQPTVSPNIQTWEEFAQNPSNANVLAQLTNSQNLIIALGHDVSHLSTQNVDIQNALLTVNGQIAIAQEQAREDSKRQSTLAWITTIVGIIGGWLFAGIAPTRPALQKGWSSLRGLFTRKVAQSHQKQEQSTGRLISLPKTVQTNPIANNKPYVSKLSLLLNVKPPLSILCPKCGKPMEIRDSAQGTKIYVCPNFRKCLQIFPVDLPKSSS